MRFLLLNQFYPPDMAPTGQVLHDLARVLLARGHAVDVVCSRRSYGGGRRYPAEESLDGVGVHRVAALGFGHGRMAGALADYTSFYVQAALRALAGLPRPDLVVALTTPPYLGLVAAAVARLRGAAHAHWVMDLYPDVLAAHGLTRAEGFAQRALCSLARRQLRGARLVLGLGPFTARRIEEYAAGARRCGWVPLWGEEATGPAPHEAAQAVRRERGWEGLVLMYSGNMGLGHRFSEFLEAARRLGRDGPLWAFAGGGKRRGEIESFAAAHPEARVGLLPYAPRERLRESLSAADVHLVSLSRAWQGLIVPSKIQGIFSVGRPALFVGPRENEIAEWIETSGGGWVVAEDDVASLLAAVEQARDAGERGRRGEAALTFAREHFDRERNCARIAALLEECVGA